MTENKNIFQLIFDLSESEKLLEESGGEGDELIETYEITKEEINAKLEKYCFVRRDLQKQIAPIDGEITYLKSEIERLENLKKPKLSNIDRIEQVIDGCLKHFAVDKLDLSIFKLSFRKSSRTVIIDESLLPKSCFTTIKKTIALGEIKKLIVSGKVKEGAEIRTNSKLQIK